MMQSLQWNTSSHRNYQVNGVVVLVDTSSHRNYQVNGVVVVIDQHA
jgi:hypothetical protein